MNGSAAPVQEVPSESSTGTSMRPVAPGDISGATSVSSTVPKETSGRWFGKSEPSAAICDATVKSSRTRAIKSPSPSRRKFVCRLPSPSGTSSPEAKTTSRSPASSCAAGNVHLSSSAASSVRCQPLKSATAAPSLKISIQSSTHCTIQTALAASVGPNSCRDYQPTSTSRWSLPLPGFSYEAVRSHSPRPGGIQWRG